MTVFLAHDLAHVLGVSRQGAAKILRNASVGKTWRGHHLPVISIDGIKGGRAGGGWGGMPGEFMIDNGGEFGFLAESVIRFAAMADVSGLGVVKCRPHNPEGKARIERAFHALEAGFISALPGYNDGNILKPRLKSRGKPVTPYNCGPNQLIEDLHLAIAQYNGTVQHGVLGGLRKRLSLYVTKKTSFPHETGAVRED